MGPFTFFVFCHRYVALDKYNPEFWAELDDNGQSGPQWQDEA